MAVGDDQGQAEPVPVLRRQTDTSIARHSANKRAGTAAANTEGDGGNDEEADVLGFGCGHRGG